MKTITMAKRVSTKSTVFEHFTVSRDEKHYVCQCKIGDNSEKTCNAKISSFSGYDKNAPTRASNLKRHLLRFHPKVLEAVKEKDNIRPTSGLKRDQKFNGGQTHVSTFLTSDQITITMSPEKFKNHLIEMVVKNNVPPSLFSQTAFLGLNGEMARKLGVSLEEESVSRLIIEEAKCKKEELRKSLKGRFFFIKMDTCTHHRVNYFAINVRFVNESNEIITRTLAVKNTKAHHTRIYLQKLVEDVFEDFEIKKEQVLCIVTDNASGILSTIEKVNKAYEESTQILEDEEPIPASNPQTVQIEESSETETLDDIAEEASKLITIQHMRCAVRILQLAIRDGLKKPYAAALIGKLRQVAVAASTPKTDAILQRRAGKGAILDRATCWGSTYLMIKRLLELQDFLEDLENIDISLTERQWAQVAQFESLLTELFSVTKKLQSEDVTPGKFLMEWKRLMYHLNRRDGLIADGIVSSMKKRECLLLNNQILLAAIYIDPNSRILLSNDQIVTGKQALYEIALHMKGLQALPETPEPLGEARSIVHSESSSSNELDFEAYLDRMEHSKVKQRLLSMEKQPVNVQIKEFQQEFYEGLKEVEKYERSSKLTVEEAIHAYPEVISAVARTVTAVPLTQSSSERLFSALKIVKSDLRASMKEDLAEAILFLRPICMEASFGGCRQRPPNTRANRSEVIANRSLIVGHYQAGTSINKISSLMGISKSKVRRWIRRFKEEGHVKTRPRCGRPRITSPEEDDKILTAVRQTPKTTAVSLTMGLQLHCHPITTRRRLQEAGLNCYAPVKKENCRMNSTVEEPHENTTMEDSVEKNTAQIEDITIKKEVIDEIFCKPGLISFPEETAENYRVGTDTEYTTETTTLEDPLQGSATIMKEEIIFKEEVIEENELFNDPDLVSFSSETIQVKLEEKVSNEEMKTEAEGR